MNKEWSERCRKEATKNVVFLLQRIKLLVIGVPSGYRMAEDSDCFIREDDEAELSFENACKNNLETDEGVYAVVKEFHPERVFLSRQEAEEYAKARHYNYRHGWDVYGLPCEGEIRQIINAGLDVVTFVRS